MNKTKLKYVKYTKQELDKYVRDKNSCITLTKNEMHVGFPPWGFSNFQETLTNIISREKIGKFDAKLDGIVLDVRNIKVFGTTYSVHDDDPVNHINIKANFYIFQPRVGAVIKGVVKHISRGHVAVIIYRVFNVSIRFNRNTVQDSLAINQQISIRIKKFDLHGAMPYIEGELIETNGTTRPQPIAKRLKFEDDDDENIGNGGDSGISTEENDKRSPKNMKAEQDDNSEDDSESSSESDSDSHNSSNERLANVLFGNVKIKQEKLSDTEENARNSNHSRKSNITNGKNQSTDSSSSGDENHAQSTTSGTKIKKESSLGRINPKVRIKQEQKSSGSSSSESGSGSGSESDLSSDTSDVEGNKMPVPLNKIKKEKDAPNATVTTTFIPRPIKVEPESDIEGKSKFKKPTTVSKTMNNSQKSEMSVKPLKRKRESSISEHLDSLVDDILNTSNTDRKSKKSKPNESIDEASVDLSTTTFQSPSLSSTLKPSSKSKQKSKSFFNKLNDPSLPSPSIIKQEPQSEDEFGKLKKNKQSLDNSKSLKSIQNDLFDSFLK